MPQVLLCVTSMQTVDNQPVINYQAILQGYPGVVGSTYLYDHTLTTDENLALLWKQVILQGQEYGVVLDNPDQFISLGLPKTKSGAPITTAELDAPIVKAETSTPSEQSTLMARATDGFKHMFDWMTG